jgi:hypothetical protein
MFGGLGRSAMALGAAFAIAAGATLWRAAAPAPALGAQSGLAYISDATWTVDPAARRIHVAMQVSATSHAADSNGRRYFFTALEMTLPPSSADYVAGDGRGDSLPVTVRARTSAGVVVDVGLRQKLYSGQSVSFAMAFDIVDSGGSADRDTRIGQGVVSFQLSAFGSRGTPGSSVTVIFPAGFAVQEPVGSLIGSTDGLDRTVFKSGTIADSTALTAYFSASEFGPSTQFLTAKLQVGPIAITLRYWADDPQWANEVGDVLVAGYPVLRGLIGLGDPATRSVTVEETSAFGIGGFSGEYNPASNTVKVASPDPIVVLHEISHLWFNSDLASDLWINEGFASFYAEQAAQSLGLPDDSPTLSPALIKFAAPLNYWTSSGEAGTATERYLYCASLEAAREVAAIAGIGGLSRIWAMARAHQAAYGRSAPDGPDILAAGALDWRRLLDYLEQSNGRSFTRIWQHWVVSLPEAALLGRRDTTRALYRATERTAGWDLPPDIRRAMGAWDFDTAQALLAEVPTIVSLRDRIAAAAPGESVLPPTSLARAFQTQTTDAALAEARLEMAALAELASARQAQSSSHGATGAVGLFGVDPGADLIAARRAFTEGDAARSASLAESARSGWSGATLTGQIRIVGTALGLAGLLLLLARFLLHRSRRREAGRPPARSSAAPPASGGPASGASAIAADTRPDA